MSPQGTPATRGAGAPPSLRLWNWWITWWWIAPNEGRRRPSLIAAYPAGCLAGFHPVNEGRRRPSLIAASVLPCSAQVAASNEGRRRPSLIAAMSQWRYSSMASVQRGAPAPLPHCGTARKPIRHSIPFQRGAPAPLPHCGSVDDPATPDHSWQRGAPAPLPHCGNTRFVSGSTMKTNEGRRRPSLIAACNRARSLAWSSSTRGAGAPPSLRLGLVDGDSRPLFATRGAGAPPSLRRTCRLCLLTRRNSNEGRRRPSLIAAWPS